MGKTIDQLASNSIYLTISYITASVFSFLFWLVLAKLLLPSEYGIISTTINFSLLLASIGIFGFNVSIIKLIPEYLVRQTNKISSLLRFSFRFTVILGLLIGLMLMVLSNNISQFLKLPTTAINFASVIVILMVVATFFDSVLRGFQNMKIIALIQFTGQLTKLGLTVALVLMGFSYFGPLVGFVSLYLIMILLGIKFVKFHKETVKIDSKQILLRYSFPAFVSILISYVFSSGRYIILNILHSPAVTGIFSLAITLTTPIFLSPNILLQSIFPLISKLSAKRRKDSITKIITFFIRYTLLMSLPISIFLIIFSKPLILIFSTENYLASAKLLPVIAIASIAYSLSAIFHQTLFNLDKTYIYRNVMIIAVLAFLITAIPLTYIFAEVGMAFSFLIFSITLGSFSYIQTNKIIKISIPYASIFKIISATTIFILTVFLLSKLSNGIIWGLVSSIIASMLYLISLLYLKFFQSDDIDIMRSISSYIPIFKKQINFVIKIIEKSAH